MPIDLALISLELGAAILYWLVFVVVESAVLQFLNWGNFRQCLRASIYINLGSAIIVVLSFVFIPRLGLPGLILGVLIVILIEALILLRLKPAAPRQAWFAAVVINLVSFFILILPVFWFSHG